MDLTEPYIKFITICDRHMHRHEYKETFLVLSQVKYWIEEGMDPVFDNDFNSRAALCALLYGQPEEALRLTEMVNLNTPGYLLVQAFRGWALKEIGYQKRANVLFNYVLNSVPDTDSVMDCLGAAISSKLLGSDLGKFFFEFAIEKFETLTGNDRKLNLLWGVFAHLKKSELETVSSDRQQTLLKSLELTKDSAEVYDYLGQTYYAQKEYDLALKCYLKSIEISPNCNFYRHIKVSFIYFYTGREEQAKTFVLRFLEQSRDLYIFYWILCPSIQLMKSNDHSEFDKYYRIGLLLYYSQVYYSSYIMLQKAKEYDPFNYKLCIFMCIVQRYLGLLDEAILNLEELKNSKYQNDIPLNIILAELYTVSQNYQKAEEMYLKIIELTPNKSFSIYIYVKFLNKMNRLDDSLVQIKKAIELEPRKVKLLIMQALIYSSLKQLDKAYETYEEVLKINPNLQSTKYQLSQINFVLNNYKKSFDQMIQIKEGEVGYEKCISLLVKLFISYPHELTKEQLQYANTNLRDRITHHLKTLGESNKQKKKVAQKQSKKGQDLESKGKTQENQKEVNFNQPKQQDGNNQNSQESLDQNQEKSKNTKEKKNKLQNKKSKKGKKKGAKKVVDEEEIQEEENIQNDKEEEEKQNNENVQIEDEEIKLEKDLNNEKVDGEQQEAEGENEDQGIDEEREIQRLLEGQSESLSELDEIDIEINESLTSPGSSSQSTEDCYREYLQKIKEENIKDKQKIYEDYSNYFNKNQHSYTKLLNQARKIKIQNLFEGNDIDDILTEELKKLKNQNDDEENNQILIEENGQNADEEIPVPDNNDNLNNNPDQQDTEQEEIQQNAQEVQSKSSQIEDSLIKISIKKKKIKNKTVANKKKTKKSVKGKSKSVVKNSSKAKQTQQKEVKVVKKVKKVITKRKTQDENLKKEKKQMQKKQEQKDRTDEKSIKKQKNTDKNNIKKKNKITIQKEQSNQKRKNQNEKNIEASKKKQNKMSAPRKVKVNQVQKEVVFRKTRSQSSTKDPYSNKQVKQPTLEITKQAKQNGSQSINKKQKSVSKVKVPAQKTKKISIKKQAKVNLKQIKLKKKNTQKTEIIKKAIKKDMTKRILRPQTKKSQKS
ncbi:hypothetical protein ABPG72_010835 [Tetrahymena utriculariae]